MIQIHSGETSRPPDFVARSLLRTYERSTCCSKSTLLLVLPSLLPEEIKHFPSYSERGFQPRPFMYCISRQIRGPYKRKKIANYLHRHRMLKVIDSIISFWMISLLGVFWGSYPRICRAKGTNQNFRKLRLSANWQPCSPSRPSLSLCRDEQD